MPRSKRNTAKTVDYSKEQEFSDDDIFEDGHDKDDDVPTPSSSRKKGRSRKSNVNSSSLYDPMAAASTSTAYPFNTDYGGSSSAINNSGYEVPEKYRHFERGYDMNLPHIRERFDFMPELELDGTPKVELIVGRRLIGETDSDGGGSDNDDDSENNDDDEDDNDEEDEDESESQDPSATPGRRKTRRNQPKKKSMSEKKKKKDEPAKHHAEYEYLIKYKGKSYLHLEWKVASELESMNKSAKNLYRRYLKKIKAGMDEDIEDPDFDPAYILPQMIVDEDEHEETVELNDQELMEWEKQQAREMEDQSSDEDDGEEEKKQDTDPEPTAASKEKDDDNNTKSEDPQGTHHIKRQLLCFS